MSLDVTKETLKERFLNLLPEERESIDTFAFSQSLLEKGGDVERRLSLICLDNSLELILKAYLQKSGVKIVRKKKRAGSLAAQAGLVEETKR